MRQCLALSIAVMGSRYLYERKPFRYLLVILLASTFHLSALIMIPFYFFSTYKLNRNIITYLLIVVAFVAIAPITINFEQDYYWSWHELTEYSGYSWKNIVLPAAISVYAFTSYSITSYKSRSSKSDLMVHKKEIISTENALQSKTDKNNIQLNATIMYLTFSISGLLFSLASRFATFFSIYAIVLFSNQIQNSKKTEYMGILPPDEMFDVFETATLLINPRLSDLALAKYSCPSKTFEYMASGRPVLMTRLPGVPDEYFDYLYVFGDESLDGYAKKIEEIHNYDEKTLSKFGLRAQCLYT